MSKKIYVALVTWVTVGLLAGLFYREFTKYQGFTGWTQLKVAHTHFLALGVLALLAVLALEKLYRLSGSRAFGWFFVTWNAGLALTGTMMLVKGTMQVLGNPAADHAAIAGISGLGHITLTVAFVCLLVALKKRVWADEQA